jgi:hypothetical protein
VTTTPLPDSSPAPASAAGADAYETAVPRPRCCRSRPRCRSCPFRLREELRAVEGLLTADETPPHLVGVPRCLHRFEPLLRDVPSTAREAVGATDGNAPSDATAADRTEE